MTYSTTSFLYSPIWIILISKKIRADIFYSLFAFSLMYSHASDSVGNLMWHSGIYQSPYFWYGIMCLLSINHADSYCVSVLHRTNLYQMLCGLFHHFGWLFPLHIRYCMDKLIQDDCVLLCVLALCLPPFFWILGIKIAPYRMMGACERSYSVILGITI